MRKTILTSAALLAAVLTSSATVTVQGWWHLDNAAPNADSSPNGRGFGSAYSTAPATGGAVAAQLINNGAGGPLDSSGWTSTQCIQVGVGVGGKRQSSMWGIGYNPPAQDFGIEIWVMPQDNGIAGGSGGWIFSSGQSGGVALRINAPSGAPSYIDAFDLSTGTTIGNQVVIDTNRWMHLALVNASGTTTFYTNGIPCGSSLTTPTTTSAGDVYMISAPGDNQAFYGYLDEARMFTFAAGAFTTNDLLLRPSGPDIITSPQNAVVWSGGAAPFAVVPSFDNSLLFQWQSGFQNIPGQNSANYYLNQVTTANTGSTFDCVVTGGGISKTSAVATLTVVVNNAANVAAYQNAVKNESSLAAYFPVDGDTGATLTNVKDATHDGTLELGATYDGRTNDTFGVRSLSFNLDGDVAIPNNPAFEFATGNGTIEALVYMSQATVTEPTIFSEVYDGSTAPYYVVGASANGGSLIYNNDQTGELTWLVPGGLVGKFSHVAWVFDNVTNVTAYVNGQSLGTKIQTSFGSTPQQPVWIGGLGTTTANNRWAGTVDELAVYTDALSQSTIQQHYSAFVYGTNTAPPSLVSQPSSKTLLAGGSPVLVVKAAGTLPLLYQWSANSQPIAGATSSVLSLSNITATTTYTLSIQNAYGSTNIQPIVLTVAAPPSGYPTAVMNDHPTAFWRLAETAGPTAVDSAGLSDAIYTTTGVTYAVGGFAGDPSAGALLDGSSGRAVTPVNYPALNPSGPFTIEFWGSLTSYAFYSPLSSMDRPARTSGYEFYIDGNSSGYEFHTAEAGGYSLITADNNVPPDGVWTYVTGVWDTTNMYLYINGQLGNYQIDPPAPAGTDNFTDEGLGQTAFVPNTSYPFFIGSRSDNTHYFKGALCDIAFYSYALTPTQITTHWSYGWVPAHVTQSPASVTNVEGSTITLTAIVTGVPNTYQWYNGATPLTDSLNSDGTPHYPNDVTNLSLVIAQATPADSGQYHIVVSNPVGGATSTPATVLITADTTPPVVTFVQGLGTPNAPPNAAGPTPYLVKVLFSKRIAANVGTFNIAGTTVGTPTFLQDVKAASLGADWREVIVPTSGLTPGQSYTLNVSGVKDQTVTGNTIVATNVTFSAPSLTPGLLEWDYYYLDTVTGNGLVSDLTGNQYYPNAPMTNTTLSTFDTTPLTGGDLNNNPAFGALGDDYGDSLSGWLTPKVTTNYYFFIASDDSSELDLSSDATTANAVSIAVCSQYTAAFAEPGNENTSGLQPLVAGHSYFIRALHVEGGGGDWVKVAWRMEADTTAAASLTPIPGTYFSAYATVPPVFNPPSFSNGKLTISWTGTGTLLESTNVTLPLIQWTQVPGNPPSPYQVTPAAGVPRMFYRLVQ